MCVTDTGLATRPSEDQLRTALTDALIKTYRLDKHLFQTKAGERSAAHKLATRLTPVVESWEGGWTVDTEFNRMSPSSTFPDAAYKYLLDVLGEPVRPAYPDLIIHRPGVDGCEGGNLLVLEAKLAPSDAEMLRDHAKLVAWCRELRYRHGVRLELRADAPSWAWLDEHADQHDPVRASAVDVTVRPDA